MNLPRETHEPRSIYDDKEGRIAYMIKLLSNMLLKTTFVLFVATLACRPNVVGRIVIVSVELRLIV